MIITHDQFKDFENAQNEELHGNNIETSMMSRRRWEMTKLDVNTYIYIADNYEEFKNKFMKG